MDPEQHAYYLVRKGDVVGLYKSLRDAQAQLGSSVCDPSMSVFKGYCLPKEAEEYLVSHGLKGATYSISASELRDDLFGQLIACPFQDVGSTSFSSNAGRKPANVFLGDRQDVGSTSFLANDGRKLANVVGDGKDVGTSPFSANTGRKLSNVFLGDVQDVGSALYSPNAGRKIAKLETNTEVPRVPSSCVSCILEFDGASKGNPGLAGAGAVVRVEDGSMVFRVREGVGIATNNVAEYRALILGLRYALHKGFKHIRVLGDSNLVCMQVQGLWKTKNQNMADLCNVAKELKDKFASFQIRHIDRELNSEADAQANLATLLKSGEVQEECERK